MRVVFPRGTGESGPVVLSTWSFGLQANDRAGGLLDNGSSALDAVEQGIRVAEDDPEVSSVGYGGLPDESMAVTLDAAIMDWRMNCGCVGCVSGIKNPISVARLVMERTRHVMLSGSGAYDFAVAHGFKKEDLLTEKSREAWLEWKENGGKPNYWAEPSHDTIGLLALDSQGHLSGGTSTSGIAWKIPGRIGDSAIIGAGLYVDGKIGAAAATGFGEASVRIVGSYLVVEGMERGRSPQEACETAIRRAIEVHAPQIESDPFFQLAFIALSIHGEVGAAAIRPGFQYALYREGTNSLIDARALST